MTYTKSEAGKLGAIKSIELAKKKLAERISNYNLNPTKCGQCTNAMPYLKRTHKFCSHSCSALYNNTRKVKIDPSKKCVVCDKQLGRNHKSCCSRKCFIEKQWLSAKEAYYKDNSIWINHKKLLIEIHTRKCSCCNRKTWLKKPIPLELEHINGNSEDNSLTNLCLICPNCHTFTPTYKSKNKGNGRYKRRLRYKEGKSY